MTVNADMLALLQAVEWSNGFCPYCGRLEAAGHFTECWFKQVVRAAEEEAAS